MGVSLSFLAVKGLAPAEVHRALGVADSGVAAGEFDYPRPAMRGAALPDGWYLVLLNSVDHRFVTSEEIPAQLSRGCEVVACRVEEHCMFSACLGWRDGAMLWQVAHDPDEDPNHLEVEGTPPAVFGELAARMRAKQVEEDRRAGEMSVDFIWEIPVELANSLCRYRHDEYADWGKPAFTVLAEAKT
jgi:hypothetical protein